MFDLDIEKLREFYKDFTQSSPAVAKKWNTSLYRPNLGLLSPSHLYYTIIAHSRGHIHATRLGTRSIYEQQAPVARPLQRKGREGEMIFNHVPYRRVAKETLITIDSLDAQAKFIGEELLARLTLDAAGKIRKRQLALERGWLRLQGKLDKLQGNVPHAHCAV